MTRICPNPMPWHAAFKRLSDYAHLHPCKPASPPPPLKLGGWAYSNDIEKMQRWDETIKWATNNGCANLVSGIPQSDFYFAEKPSSYTVGPMGGPMYRPWDFESKPRISTEQVAQLMSTLLCRWTEIAGSELANVTRPLAITGEKARRLLVLADGTVTPPWGGWSHLSHKESKRRVFTHFRAAINKAIAPHEIDHIDFTIEEEAEHAPPEGRDVPPRP